MTTKIFCIGFHKTGTTSLAVALKALGYRVTGPNGVNDPDIAKNVHAMTDQLVRKFDAFQDNPWPIIYKDLDRRYPGSKFILTLRDTNQWLKSQVKYFGERESEMRKWIYGAGCPVGNEETYVRIFDEHNRDVVAHFSERPDDLLVMELAKGDGWEKLCPFLGKKIPDVPFPHVNKGSDRDQPLAAKVLRKARETLAGMRLRMT